MNQTQSLYGRASSVFERRPTRRGYFEPKKFGKRPTMIGQPGGNGWGTLHPATPPARQIKRDTQAVVIGTEIVNTSQQKHTGLQSVGLANQGASAAGQMGQTFPKDSIESLDEKRCLTTCTKFNSDQGRSLARPSRPGRSNFERKAR